MNNPVRIVRLSLLVGGILLLQACSSLFLQIQKDGQAMVGKHIEVAYAKLGKASSVEQKSDAQGPYRAYSWRWQKWWVQSVPYATGYVSHPDGSSSNIYSYRDVEYTQWCRLTLFTDLNNIIFESQSDHSKNAGVIVSCPTDLQ